MVIAMRHFRGVPAVLRHALLGSPEGSVRKTPKLNGWTLVLVRPSGNTYQYTLYAQ